MYYYRIAGLILQTFCRLASFGSFVCDPSDADVILEETNEQPPLGREQCSGSIIHRTLADGWFIYANQDDSSGLYANADYTRLRFLNVNGVMISGIKEWCIRIALECRLARMGYVSLHAAAIETDGKAYAFTGPSGIGKSTRAASWIDVNNARLINGDRPLIDVRKQQLFGVPWDGKEKCYQNVVYPLEAICDIRRSESTYLREMSFEQRRKLLLRQCFIPMWDTETAAIQMANIVRLAMNVKIVRAFGGPTTEDARALLGALQDHNIIREEKDMKAKTGFVLRNVVDEYLLMPIGENIGQFNGTVLLNEVSAFVWEKLQSPLSRADLLQAILDEYEVDKATASADLDALLKTLRDYDVIEDD